MMRRTTFLLTMALFVFTSSAYADNLVFCLPGFPGTKAQAQPYVDKMLRHLETKLGQPANSTKGQYLTDAKQGIELIKKEKPSLALLEPSIYAELQSDIKMKVIAKIEVQGRGEQSFGVVVKKGTIKSLEEIKDKILIGPLVRDKKYVQNVLLDNKVKLQTATLKEAKRPLRALRAVQKGTADAAIVDEATLNHLKDLPGGDKLEVLYRSPQVISPLVVVFDTKKNSIKRLRDVLVNLCSNADGKPLCKQLTISSIKPANPNEIKKFLKKYTR